MLCFFGVQSQVSAQADAILVMGGSIDPDETTQILKDIDKDYDFSSLAAEDVVRKLKEFGTPIMSATETDPVKEVEQQFTIGFMVNISLGLETSSDVASVVNSSVTNSLNSPLAIRYQNEIDFQDLVEDVLDAID
jgi:hypothetical protein